MENLTVESAVEKIRAAKTLDELTEVDNHLNEMDTELEVVGDPGYRAAFDAAELALSLIPAVEVPEVPVTQELPDDPEALKSMIRELQAAQAAAPPKAKARGTKVRAGVSYKILRKDVHFKQNQAEAIAQALINSGKSELTEAEVKELVDAARAARVLGGGQDPMRIFRYYMAEGTIGYKARGFLQKLG